MEALFLLFSLIFALCQKAAHTHKACDVFNLRSQRVAIPHFKEVTFSADFMEEGAGAVGGEVEQFAIIETEQKKYQSLSFTGRPVMLIHCTRQRHRQSGSNVTWAVCNGSSQFAAAELV